MIKFVGFKEPVDFAGSGSEAYYSANKHPGVRVTEDGPWFTFRMEHPREPIITRVPVTNINYVRDSEPPPKTEPKKAA